MRDQVVAPAAARVALLAGATGLVGQAVLAALLTDKRYAAVHCVGRRALTPQHPKVFSHVADFATLSALPGIDHVDDVFIALGTTLKVAGSQAAFRALDFEAIVALARVGKALGATKLAVVSALGADPSSRVFYNRVKGEMEQAVSQLGYPVLVIARPSLLSGDRDALAQTARPAEKLGLFAMALLKPLIPANYRPVAATQVASAMLSAVHDTERGTRVLSSGEMQAIKSV
ncbi:MAG: nucleoside-diphosphate sugar epimerase [Rhodoferax sp.]|nr:nucleoside-diphosphate sugar epimerase [Rhodoferax sp.]NDP39782.1 nucleoside-diphosphate sugar epimerase [Rhodoferax sp.]